jgi:hypothetical protein
MRGRSGNLKGIFHLEERRRLELLAKSGRTSFDKIVRVLALERARLLEDIELEKLVATRLASFSTQRAIPHSNLWKRA